MFRNFFKFFSVVFLLFVFAFSQNSFAQTTLISPAGDGGFENGGTPAANGWTAVNATTDNWVVGIANPPGPSAGTNAGYVSTDGGTTWTYSQLSTIIHLYKDVTIPAGESKVSLSFKWKVGGEGSTTSDWDNMKVFWGVASTMGAPVLNTALGSGFQVSGPGALSGMYKLSSVSYNSETINLTGAPGTTYRLVFSWKSDVSTIANPPAAIDEVSLISSTPAPLIGGNIYPINGTQNPPTSFASITTASAYLASDGVTGSGQVIFELATGYAGEPGPVSINSIPGTSSTLGVTFRPAVGYTALTSIAGAASPNQHAIKMNGCSYVTLDGRAGGLGTNRDWTVRVTGSGASGLGQMAVRMDNTSASMTGNNVRYLIMEGESANTTGAIFQITGSTTNTISNIVIENNLIQSTSSTSTFLRGYGITLAVASNVANTGIIVRNNNITQFHARGINLTGGFPGIEVYGNNIYHTSTITQATATEFAGIYFSTSTSTGAKIYNNYIYDIQLTNGSTAINGIQLVASNSTGTIPAFYNNRISIGSGITVMTIPIYGFNYSSTTTTYPYEIYFNSVLVNGTATSGATNSAAFRKAAGNVLNIKNNIFYNERTNSGATGVHWGISVNNTTFTSIGNNDYFASGTGGVLGTTDGTTTGNKATLALWNAAVPTDLNSVSQNPNYVAGLKIDTTPPTQLESGGTPITGLTLDFEGETRNASTPDIGADEFTGILLDLTPPIISYTPLLNTNSISNRTLVASITDPGSGVNGITLTAPRVYYKKSTDANAFVGNTSTDNGWKWTEATGTSPFSFTIDNSIIFGGSVTTGDVIQYFVVAQDLATTPNTGANPSLGFVGTSVSSITSAPTTPSSYIISSAPLAGSYTVGLTLFNQVTGKNIYFDKVITKVMKEVDVEVPQEVPQYAKGQEPQDQNQTSFKPQTVKQLMEVEEISWIPMQNGQPYYGDLYVKKVESPEFNYPVGTDGIYSTITAAVADLNLRGVGGATTFLLNDASYTTGETYPIVIKVANEGNFPTATNTVTIKPNTGVTALIQGAAAAGQIFKILNSYVTIDGSNAGGTDRSLTIENTSVTTPQVIVFGSTGTTPIVGNALKNCIIRNGVTSSTAIVVSDGTAPGTAGYFNNITIQNNSIGKAYMGVYNIAVMTPGNGGGLLLTGNDLNNVTPNHIALVGIYVQGVDGATVSNNNIGNYTTTYTSNITGVWFATGTVNSNISGNTIGPINITTAPPRGIVITSAVPNANVVVNDNIITGMITSYSGADYGIYVFSTTSGVSVLKNKISNIKNTSTAGYSAIGIALGSSLTAANITVANNFIWDVAAYGYASTTTDNGYGINLLSGDGYNVYFNSIALITEQTSATGNPACLIINSAITTPASLEIRDNIFATFQTVGAQRYALLCNAANTVFSNINYNDWYSLGPNLGYIGRNRLDLDSLRAGTGQDLQSISGDPNFVSTSDLHINTAYNTVSNNGQYLAAVPTDIDGTLRSASTPDIGADEYIYVAPSVIDPSGVTATAISSSQIDVAFTPNASSNNVVIVYNLTGTFTTPTGTPVVGGTLADGEVLYINTISPYSHLSLISSTHYYYKLFSYNGSMYSDGVAVDATTLCGVFAAPWTQDFESGVFPPLCWSLAGSATALWNSSSAIAAGISGYGVGSYSAFADFWGVSAGSQDLISFDYDASSLTNAQLKFDWAYQDYSGSADTLKIYYSTDAGTSWTLLAAGYDLAAGSGLFNLITNPALSGEYGGTTNPVLTSHWMTIAFGLPAGTNKVKFTAISDYGNNLFVDNIKIEAAPAHDIGVTALTRNYGTMLERVVETGFSREIAENSVDKNGNKIENVSIRILYPEQKENPPEAPVNLLAVVENFGGAVENSYQVGWQIDGTPQTSVSNTQPLEVGDVDTLTLTWPTATAGSHSSRAWTILGTDANAANDSSGILAFYVCPDNAIYCEQFEQGLIPPTGWQTYNQDGGTATPWFVGNPTVFTAYESSGYIANNYQRANGFFIDDWLVTSNTGGIPLGDADVDSLVFWMRSPDGSTYPDSVEIRLSTTGQAVGDFTVLLDHFKVPTTGWTRFAYVLPEATNRYIAFRYLMYDGGSAGNSSDYIGLDLVQILRYTVSNTFQLTVNVADGWNMVSIPGLHPTDQNVSTWWQYRDLGANVFRYAGGYQPVTTAAPGTGYWMKHAGALTYDTGGEWPAGGIQIVTHDPLTAASGWNLIGGYELSVGTAGVTTIPSGLQEGPIYKYSGGYQTATTLDPGYGYWIKLSASGQIIIPETLAKDGKPVEYFPDSWGKIVLTDAAGINYTLYAVEGEVNLSQYELPPAPPTGMFDIRYSSGRIAEDLNSAIKTIDMSGVTYPLTVRVEGMDIRLMDETGKTVNVNLKDGEDIVISDATIQKLMVSGELIPAVYSLEQNYPNPFNPSTMIEFSLPENVGNVKLSIYNALGEKVAELVNTALVAGKYSYQWNAQNVATGMYIYELRTDKFVSVKKMLLLK